MNGIHCIVSGRVQGVFFRASTQDIANRLGLKGWVKNRHDGAVELHACGEDKSLKQLQVWLSKGPADATVTDVVCETVGCHEVGSDNGFCVTYD